MVNLTSAEDVRWSYTPHYYGKNHINSYHPVNYTRRGCAHISVSGSHVTANQSARVEFGPALFRDLVLLL